MAPTPPGPDGPLLAGRYRLGARLGTGGMGEVLDGWDERLGRPVAVKVLRPDLAARPDVRERFDQEARLAARLLHPNVVAVFDSGDEAGTAFLVMERLSGRTFAEVIDAGPVEPGLVREVGLQVLAALEAAHRAGLVHRDIKPSNILDAGEGRWKVGDFGIAKSTEAVDPALTSTGLVVGTAAYLTPERLAGSPADASSDLYALGVVLYEALAGRRDRTPGALIPHRPPLASLRAGLPVGLVAAVERATSGDPAVRFATAPAMAAALSAAAGPDATTVLAAPVATTGLLPPAATEVLAPAPLGPPPRVAAAPLPVEDPDRSRWVIGLLVVLIVAALIALGALLLTRGGGNPGPSTTTVPTTVAPSTTTSTSTSTTSTTTSSTTSTTVATTTTTVPATTTTQATTTSVPPSTPPTVTIPSAGQQPGSSTTTPPASS